MGWGSHHRGRNPSREPGPRSRPFDLRLLRSPRIASLDPVGRGETPRRRAARACRVFRREAPQTEQCARTHIRLRQHFTGMPGSFPVRGPIGLGGHMPHRPESGPSQAFGASYTGGTIRRSTGCSKASALAAPGRGAIPGSRPSRRRPWTTCPTKPQAPGRKQAREGREVAGRGRGGPAPRRLSRRRSRSCGGGGACVCGVPVSGGARVQAIGAPCISLPPVSTPPAVPLAVPPGTVQPRPFHADLRPGLDAHRASRARRPGNACVPPASIGGGLAIPFAGGTQASGRRAVPRTPCPRAFARGAPGENPTAHMPRQGWVWVLTCPERRSRIAPCASCS